MGSFNHFDAWAERLPELTSKVTRKVAFDWQAAIQSKIRSNKQIDTGFMLNSVYVVTSQDNTYSGGARALPPIGPPPDNQTAYVSVAAWYAWFQNFGTTRIPGRDFMESSKSRVKAGLDAALAAIEGQMPGGR